MSSRGLPFDPAEVKLISCSPIFIIKLSNRHTCPTVAPLSGQAGYHISLAVRSLQPGLCAWRLRTSFPDLFPLFSENFKNLAHNILTLHWFYQDRVRDRLHNNWFFKVKPSRKRRNFSPPFFSKGGAVEGSLKLNIKTRNPANLGGRVGIESLHFVKNDKLIFDL